MSLPLAYFDGKFRTVDDTKLVFFAYRYYTFEGRLLDLEDVCEVMNMKLGLSRESARTDLRDICKKFNIPNDPATLMYQEKAKQDPSLWGQVDRLFMEVYRSSDVIRERHILLREM